MATSLNSILDTHPDLGKGTKADRPRFDEAAAELAKMGQRHGKKDKATLQTAHDAVAELAGGIHCVMKAETDKAQGVNKANARHSKKDLGDIQKCQGYDDMRTEVINLLRRVDKHEAVCAERQVTLNLTISQLLAAVASNHTTLTRSIDGLYNRFWIAVSGLIGALMATIWFLLNHIPWHALAN